MQSSRAVTPGARNFRYYDLMVGGMVAVLLCANLIGPAKVCTVSLPVIGALSFGAGNLFFPVSYIFGDILTEVYGYSRARRAIWAGFGGLVFASIMAWVVVAMPASPNEPFNATLQPALEVVFGNTGRIVIASMVAYWLGDFANSYVMAKMKVMTGGRYLWTRTIGSTLIGQGVDSLTFYPLAFIGIWESQTLIKVVAFNWTMKVLVEVVFTPLTYAVVGFLKRHEGVDTFDRHTRFTPFSLRDEGEVERYD
ncbi:queuosine precursor transporter [Oleiagrimonas sp. C23AA]|uniref:queuosine precursor transporter n=1 Tax=Oleiagrimonas sp. C23AA TaxID=2719047 RepID=UPI001423E8FD|nr:queuosine precursor transporter [Oleiagrimonas sp. C23AA]NII09591.1 queuosine precursor transporter [Oleiagrimonas sp. C23AA]